MKYLWQIRWLIPCLLVGYVLWQALFAAGSLEAATDFRERTPYFDVLLPAGRVERTAEGIVLKQEPVYIDIRLPVRVSSAFVELKIDGRSAPIRLGLQTGDDFAFAFSKDEPETTAGLTLYRYDTSEFDYARPGHKARFIISAPALTPGSIVVKGATVSFRRQSSDLDWWRRLFMQTLWN